jgi:hypothetical protein
MRTLRIRVRNWCAPWACMLGTDAHPEHTHQFLMRISFPIFQMFILYTLIMHLRTWCVHWACASETDACTEHARQKLMRTLSIRVRNWCVHWVYASGTHTCSERIPFKMLSIHFRNWCLPWAYVSGTDAFAWSYPSVSYVYAQHKNKNSKFEKVPSKHAEHACQELMRALSLRIRNWCAGSACASEIKRCLAPSKI